jgi:hypothetical protein
VFDCRFDFANAFAYLCELCRPPSKLNSLIDHLEKYADNFFTEASKSAGKVIAGGIATLAVGKAIGVVSLCYLLIDQLTALSNFINDWISLIGALVS